MPNKTFLNPGKPRVLEILKKKPEFRKKSLKNLELHTVFTC